MGVVAVVAGGVVTVDVDVVAAAVVAAAAVVVVVAVVAKIGRSVRDLRRFSLKMLTALISNDDGSLYMDVLTYFRS